METEFEKRLASLINEYSKENDSDTPDFILARYLNEVLQNFNAAIMDREQWYNREKHVEDDSHYKIPFDYDGTTNTPSSDYGDNLIAVNEFRPIDSPIRKRNFSPEIETEIDELYLKSAKLIENIEKIKESIGYKIKK